MKQFKGYDEAKKAAQYSGAKLPEGAYVCKIAGTRYVPAPESGKSDIIEVYFDILEGEYKNFFKTQFDNNPSEDKKWKGKKNIYVPFDDGSEKDEWTKKTFAKWTNALEDSNKNYTWDWDETKWKALDVGIVFGTTGTVIDGKNITYTEARFPCSVDSVRNGKAPKAKFQAKNGYSASPSSIPTATGDEPWMQVAEGDEADLPFNL